MKPYGLLLLCLSVIGCAPPYIVELDKAAALTHHMTAVGTFGPLSSTIGNTQTGVRFLPTKPTAASIDALSIQSGFVVTEYAGFDYLQFAYMDSSGQAQLTSEQDFSLAGADPNYPLYEFDVTTTTSSQASMIIFRYDPVTLANGTYQQFVATLPAGPMATPTYALPPAPPLTNTILTGWTPIGGSVVPAQPPTQDSFVFLGASGVGSFTQGGAQVNGVTSIFPTGGAAPAAAATPIPAATLRAMYYLNPVNGFSVASFFSAGQWVCWQWSGASQTLMSGITHRVDAVLTTGDLLSTEGDTLRLYNPGGTGTELYAIPMNGLQFCYEAYVGTTPYVFFSLPLSLQHGDMAFNVYAIPTSSMRGLKG